MGYLPTNKQIKEEVSNYDELTFFKKIKNIFIVFILVMSAISAYINYTTGTFFFFSSINPILPYLSCIYFLQSQMGNDCNLWADYAGYVGSYQDVWSY